MSEYGTRSSYLVSGPYEAGEGSYRKKYGKRNKCRRVSGPYRGMGSFLQGGNMNKQELIEVSGPSRGLGGGLSKDKEIVTGKIIGFPAPLEGWVGS